MPILTVPMLIAVAVPLLAVGCERQSSGGSRTAAAAATADQPREPSDDERYELRLSPGELPVDRETPVQFEIHPGQELKINRDYPSWSLTLESPDELGLSKTTFESDAVNLADDRATVETTAHPEKPGTYRLEGTASFSVCNQNKCHLLPDAPLRFEVEAVETSSGD